MALSDITGGSFQLTAGAAIAQDAFGRLPLIEIGADGRAYPAVTSDYAAVTAAGQIVAQTSIVGAVMLGGNSSNALYVGLSPVGIARNAADGSIFQIAPNSASGGVAVYKLNPAGAVLGSLTLDGTSAALHLQSFAQLANGNFAAVWNTSAGSNTLTYAVFDQNLAVVKAPTAIENAATITAGANISMAALSGGGFAIGWASAGTTRPRLAIYNNAGAVVSAPADVKATSGTYNIKVAQLSNGNIVYAMYNPGAAGAGMQFAIYGPTGAVVLALSAPTGTTSASGFFCLLSVMASGYFAIGFANSATYLSVNVYNNAGTQQGGTFTPQTSIAMQVAQNVLANDGTQFWLMADTSSGTKLSSIQTTGAVGAVNNLLINASGYTNYSCSGFIENGYFVFGHGTNTGNASNFVYVVSLSAPTLAAQVQIGSAPGTYGSAGLNIIPAGGDFAYLAAYDQQTVASTNFYVGKYAGTSIVGVAVTSAAVGAYASVQPNRIGGGTAAYGASLLVGTSPKAFDHSGATIPGNKGVLMTNGAVLKGM